MEFFPTLGRCESGSEKKPSLSGPSEQTRQRPDAAAPLAQTGAYRLLRTEPFLNIRCLLWDQTLAQASIRIARIRCRQSQDYFDQLVPKLKRVPSCFKQFQGLPLRSFRIW